MSAKLIDGKAFAEGLIKRVGIAVSELKNRYNLKPGLAVVLDFLEIHLLWRF